MKASAPLSSRSSSSDGTATVLEAVDVSVGYGMLPVVRDLNVRVDAGEVVALVGSNGAGKTTTMLAMAGELRPTAGTIRFLGEATTAPLHERARKGLRFVTEERSIFPGLTTEGNLRLGKGSIDRAYELFPELRPLANRSARLLSGGEQQMLTLARALSADLKVLLADELSLGLAPLVVQRLLAAVRSAADERGVGVLLVEQQVRQALTIADRAYVMRRGRVVLSGTAEELLSRIDEIESTYLTASTGEEAVE